MRLPGLPAFLVAFVLFSTSLTGQEADQRQSPKNEGSLPGLAAGQSLVSALRVAPADGHQPEVGREAGKPGLPLGALGSLAMQDSIKVIQAGQDWCPIQWEPARILKGSALDFSSSLDAPAGKWGEVVCQEGRFVFKDRPQKPVRLYGVVVTHGLPFLDKDRCRQFADYLAACGYGAVRLHCYNFAKGVMKEIGSAEFAPEALDQLDYLFFCLKSRGIYYTFPLNAWGFFKPGDVRDIPEFRDRPFRFESNGLLPISADMRQWFKDYARHLLGHTNPYTGMALKDDPALLSIELTNEDSLLAVLGHFPELVPIYRRKCRERMQADSGTEPTAEQVEHELPRFALQLQDEFYRGMKQFLREAGVRQPLTDANVRDNMAYALPRSQMDYVDIHAYWALAGDSKGGEQPFRQTWTNPNTVTWSYFLGPVAARLFGKPYACSEFNGCYPTPYWIYTGPVEAALAAGQGWSMVTRCGLASRPQQFFAPSRCHRIETSASPLLMFSERIGNMLFLQGELPPLPVKLPLVLTPEYLLEKLDILAGPKYPTFYTRLAFRFQLGTILLDGREKLDGYPCLIAPPDMRLPASLAGKRVLRADASLEKRLSEYVGPGDPTTPRFELDAGRGSAQIVTRRSETFLLPAGDCDATGRVVRLVGSQSPAVCFAGSLDQQPLADSQRILLLYLTDQKNSGAEIECATKPRDVAIVRKGGKLPLLVRQGKIRLTFTQKGRPLPEIWALRYDGGRSVQIHPQRTADGFAFEVQAVTKPDTFSAYEVAWGP